MTERLAILGASGMLGHRVVHEAALRGIDAVAVSRTPSPALHAQSTEPSATPLFAELGFNAAEPPLLEEWLSHHQASAVINCIGIVRQKTEANEAIASILVNSLFPHRLAKACSATGVQLIHLSTDCVFSGRVGRYRETDLPDPTDLYGRSKLLGEVAGDGVLTLRTSIVGWELASRHGLLEWFATQRRRRIRGFRRAVFSGLTTAALSRLLVQVARRGPLPNGVYHVAADPISKYDLLVGLRDRLGWHDIDIEPDDDFTCDRSLDGTRFREATGWTPPSWDEMLDELSEEWLRYAAARESK